MHQISYGYVSFRRVARVLLAAIFSVVSIVSPVYGANGTWTLDGSGSWFTPANWQGNIVGGGSLGDVVNFTNDIAANTTVSLDASWRLVGALNFSDNGTAGSTWTIAGPQILYFGMGSGTPTITTNTNTIIDARIGSWTSNQGLLHNGSAALILTHDSNSISGTITNASGGLLQFGNGGTTGNISSSGISNSGTLHFNYAPGTIINFNSTISGSGAVQIDSGTVSLPFSTSSYTGQARVQSDGVLRGSLPNAAHLLLSGGIYELSGNFFRSIGTAAGQVQWSGSGGFSAVSSTRLVQLNGSSSSTVTWGSGEFVADGSPLLFNSPTAGGVIQFDNPLHLAGGTRTIHVFDNPNSTSDRAVMTGVISNGGLTKDGAGHLSLTNVANTYSGATSIVAGTLRATVGTSLPTASNLTLAGGVFETSGTFNRSLGSAGGNVQWTAGGGFSATSTLTIQLNGGTGAVAWGSGHFVPSGSPLLFGSVFATAVTDFQNAIDLNGATRTIAVEDNVNSTGDRARLSGILSNGGLLKTGSGLLELTGGNTYSGTTTISLGALRAADGVGLPTASNLTLNGGVWDAPSGTMSRNLGTGAGEIQWTAGGGFAAQSGTLTVQLNGGNSAVTWGAGGFVPAGAQLIFGSNLVSTTQTVDFQNAVDLAAAMRTINVTTGTAQLSGELSNGGLTKIGGGTLVLTAANSFVGGTTIDAGVLQLSGGDNRLAVSGDVTLNSGTFNIGSTNQTIDVLQANSGTVSGTGILTANGYDLRSVSMNVVMAGSGGILKTTGGGVTLSRINTFTGPVEIRAGQLNLSVSAPAGADGALGNATSDVLLGHTSGSESASLLILSSTGTVGRNIVVQAGSTGTITIGSSGGGAPSYTGNITLHRNVNLSGSGTLSFGTGTISGSGGVTTSGTVVFNAPTTYLGDTIVDSGTLRLAAGDNTLRSGANIRVNSSGTLDLGANNQAAGLLQILGGTINGTGTLTAATFSLERGTINVVLGGSANLQKVSSTSTLILNAANTYTGATEVTAGALRAADGVGLPADSNLTLNGGVYESSGTFVRQLGTGPGHVQFTGSGGFAAFGGVFNIQLNGNTNAVTWNSGDFIPDGSSLLFGSTTANNLVDFQNGINLNGAVRTISVTDASGSADRARISGVVSNGGLTKAGTGVLILSNANTYTGTTSVLGGALVAGTDAPSGAPGAFGNATSAILLGDMSTTASASLYVDGPYHVARDVIVQATPGGDHRIGTDTQHIAGTFSGNITLNRTVYLTANSGSRIRFQSGTISGDTFVYKDGSGTVELRAANTYTGITYANQGILRLAGGDDRIAPDGWIYVNNGTFDVSNISQSIDTLRLYGGSIIGIGSITPTSTNNVQYGRVSAVLAGSTGLTIIAGNTLTMAGPATYTGGTSILAGTLALAGNAPHGAAGTLGNATSDVLLGDTGGTSSASLFAAAPVTVARNITVQSGSSGGVSLGANIGGGSALFSGNVLLNRAVVMSSSSNGTVQFTGVLSGAGGITTQTGNIVLTGANTFSGGTTINSGTLTLTGGNHRLPSTGAIALAGGALNLLETTQSAGSFTMQNGTLAGMGTLQAGGYSLSGGVVNAVLGGGADLVRTSNVTTLYLNSVSTYTGSTTLNTGDTYLRTSAPANGAGALGNSATAVLLGDTFGSQSASLRAAGSILVGRDITVRSGSSGTITLGSQGTGVSYFTGDIDLQRNVQIQSGDTLRFEGGSVSGAGAVTLNGGGIAVFNTANSYSGGTTIGSGKLRAVDGVGLPTSGNLVINGGVLESRGVFNRSLGSGAGQVRFTGTGGLAAFGGDLVVRLNGNTGDVVRAAGEFTPSTLRLSGTTATHVVDFQNGIDLNGGQLTVHIDDNASLASDMAVLSGVLSNGALRKTGDGTLRLTAANTFTGVTTISAGVLQVAGGDNRLASTGSVMVSGGVLDLTDTAQTLDVMTVGSGTVQGAGRLIVASLSLTGGTIDVAVGGNTAIQKSNSSTTAVLRGPSSYTGVTTISSGALQGDDGVGLSSKSNLNLAGGVFESRGTFERAIGTAAGQVRWTASGGFSAQGGTLNVRLNGNTDAVVWGGADFVPVGTVLRFGSSTTADSLVDLQNDLDLADGQRTIEVVENYSSSTDVAQISGTIRNGALYKNGAGVLRLVAANTFVGGTVVANGTLQLSGGDNRLAPGGSITINSGTLDLTDTNQTASSFQMSGGTITGSGVLTSDVLDLRSGSVNVRLDGAGGMSKSGSSHVTISQANGYTGTTRILTGTLQLAVDAPSGADGALGNSTTAVVLGADTGSSSATLMVDAGRSVGRDIHVQAGNSGSTLLYANGSGTATFSGNLQLDKNVTLATSSSTSTLNFQTGVISGAGGVTTNGAGLVILAGTNTYAGATTVNGVLQAIDGVGLPTASALTLNSGVLQSGGTFNRSLGTSAGQLRWNGDGGFAAQGATLTVQLNGGTGTLLWGSTDFITGTLAMGSATADALVDFRNGLDLGNSQRTVFVTDNAASTTDVAQLSGLVSNGGLTKSGTGVLRLTAANTFTGTLQINQGTVVLSGGDHRLSPAGSILVQGTLDLTDTNQTTTSLTTQSGSTIVGSGTLIAATLSLNGGTIGVALGGSARATISGNVTLTGANSYSGGTFLTGGVLTAADGVGLPTTGNLVFAGGVLQTSGTFSRTLGYGTGQARWAGSGGFAAFGAPLVVRLNGGTSTVVWGMNEFMIGTSAISFGSSTSDHQVDFQNGVNLAGDVRTISVNDNVSTTADLVMMSGVLTNGGIIKSGSGTLRLTGNNSYTSGTHVSSGTLQAGHNWALGTGLVSVSGGTLEVLPGIALANSISINGGTMVVEAYHRPSWSVDLNWGALNVTGAYTQAAGSGTAANLLAVNSLLPGNAATVRLIGNASTAGVQAVVLGTTFDGRLEVSAGRTLNNTGTGATLTTLGNYEIAAGSAYLGLTPGAAGYATVTGQDSLWSNGRDLYVGHDGTGTLSIQDRATVTNRHARLGEAVGATGTAVVSGGTWTNSGVLLVGRHGTGTLSIQSGGIVTAADAMIGLELTGRGTTTVNGVGSHWDLASALVVGNFGRATLNIQSSGRISSDFAILGAYVEAVAAVNMSDGGIWNTTGSLTVADFGTATMSVLGGSQVSSSEGFIGKGSGSTGSVIVRDFGSSWTLAGELAVGGATSASGGVGELTIGAGATVSGVTTARLWSSGTLHVDGGSFSASQIRFTDGGVLNYSGGSVSASSVVVSGFNNTVNVGRGASLDVGFVSGSGEIRKLGSGQVVVQTTNTYSGTVRVEAGAFTVNGTLPASSTTVGSASRAVLNGDGGLGGAVTIAANGALSAGSGGGAGGNGIGSLHLDNQLTLHNGSALIFDFQGVGGVDGSDVAPGTNWDFIQSTGSLGLETGSATAVYVNSWNGSEYGANTGSAPFDPGTVSGSFDAYRWKWMEFDDGIFIDGSSLDTSTELALDGFFWVSSSHSGDPFFGTGAFEYYAPSSVMAGFYVTAYNDGLYLNYSAVPEPSSLALSGIAALAFATHRKRRRAPGNSQTRAPVIDDDGRAPAA